MTDWDEDVSNELWLILQPIWSTLTTKRKLDADLLGNLERDLLRMIEDRWQEGYRTGFMAGYEKGSATLARGGMNKEGALTGE